MPEVPTGMLWPPKGPEQSAQGIDYASAQSLDQLLAMLAADPIQHSPGMLNTDLSQKLLQKVTEMRGGQGSLGRDYLSGFCQHSLGMRANYSNHPLLSSLNNLANRDPQIQHQRRLHQQNVVTPAMNAPTGSLAEAQPPVVEASPPGYVLVWTKRPSQPGAAKLADHWYIPSGLGVPQRARVDYLPTDDRVSPIVDGRTNKIRIGTSSISIDDFVDPQRRRFVLKGGYLYTAIPTPGAMTDPTHIVWRMTDAQATAVYRQLAQNGRDVSQLPQYQERVGRSLEIASAIVHSRDLVVCTATNGEEVMINPTHLEDAFKNISSRPEYSLKDHDYRAIRVDRGGAIVYSVTGTAINGVSFNIVLSDRLRSHIFGKLASMPKTTAERLSTT